MEQPPNEDQLPGEEMPDKEEQEPEGPHWNCERCGVWEPFSPQTVCVVRYPFPQYDTVLFACSNPEDEEVDKYFLDQFPDEVKEVIEATASEWRNEIVKPHTIAEWNRIHGVPEPKTYELTPRHEAEIKRLGETLELISDDLLFNMFESPMLPNNMPDRWVDDDSKPL